MNPIDRRSFVKVPSAASAPVWSSACAGGDQLFGESSLALYPRVELAQAYVLTQVSALLAEQDEEWMTAKIYLTMKP